MSFFAPFSEPEKDLFRTASTMMELGRGEYLMRRGEPGGDIFLIEDGALEVVDRRATPEVILITLQPGAVVGEMSFVEDSPRSADVRATMDSRVRRWARGDLRSLLEREPVVAARFFEAVARMASTRIRNITTNAVIGGIGGKTAGPKGSEEIRAQIVGLSDEIKESLLKAEQDLRTGASAPDAANLVSTTLDRLQSEVATLFAAETDPHVHAEGTRLLGRELHPYLTRSALGDRCIRRRERSVGQAEVIAHVLVDTPSGEGPLGELIDRWLLSRPTLHALRQVRDAVVSPVAAHLPDHRNRRVLVLNAGTGSLVAALGTHIGDQPTVLTVVDPSREALAFLDAGVALRPRKVELRTAQHSLVQLALGRVNAPFHDQDAIVVHGLLEYMPDRIVLALLKQCQQRLAPDGMVVATALAPTADAPFLDRVLGWPTVRRGSERFLRLFRGAGLNPRVRPPREDGLLVVEADRCP